METMIRAIIVVIQLVAAGFVMWGAWLCFKDWFRSKSPARDETAAPAVAQEPKVDSCERGASLVVLALLCTPLVAAV